MRISKIVLSNDKPKYNAEDPHLEEIRRLLCKIKSQMGNKLLSNAWQQTQGTTINLYISFPWGTNTEKENKYKLKEIVKVAKNLQDILRRV